MSVKTIILSTIHLFLFLGIWGCTESTNQHLKPPNVLVVTMDTTRSDHLHCYGYEKIRTPVLDQLAKEGVLFEQALSVQPVTLPAHTSIFTGQYPFSHGVRDNSTYQLADSAMTMAEVFKSNGYHTAALISAFVLHRRFGLNQGFDLYNDSFIKPKQKGRLPVDRRASEVSFLAGEWLRINRAALTEKPFFLWLHYYDPHADYNPPEPYRSAYNNRYDGEIAYMDDWIGYVFDSLKLEDLWDNTIVVVIGDHGESLGEYGENTHGLFIYQPTIRVPFIIRWPKMLPQGKRISYPVCSIDLFPTLMKMVSLSGPDENFQGINLLPAICDDIPIPQRNIYRETYIPENFNWSHLAGIQGGSNLYIQAPKPELITLDPKGNQVEDVTGTEFELAGKLQDQLNRMTGERADNRSLIALDPDTELKLQALGYFVSPDQVKPDQSKAHQRPDPKDRISTFNSYQAALGLNENGLSSQAIAIMEQLIEQETNNVRFVKDLATMYMEAGDLETAKKQLKKILEVNPDDLEAHLDLGVCMRTLGDYNEAIHEFRAALAINEANYSARFNLAFTYLKTEDINRAENEFLLCQTIMKNDVNCLNNLGYIAIRHKNDWETGINYLLQAHNLEPQNCSILLSLGNAYKNLNKLESAAEILEQGLLVIPDHEEILVELIDVYGKMNDNQKVNQLKHRLNLLNTERLL